MTDYILKLGLEIDQAIDDYKQNQSTINSNKLNGFKLKLEEKIKQQNIKDKSTLYYYLGNIFFEYYKKDRKEKNKKHAIQNFYNSTLIACDDRLLLPRLTNLGTILWNEHRYYEAIYFYQRANDIEKRFLLPLGLKVQIFGIILEIFDDRRDLFLEFHRIILLEINNIKLDFIYPKEEKEQIGGQKLLKEYKQRWDPYFQKYYKNYNDRTKLNESIKDSILIKGEKKLKNKYVLWCRDNFLLLNLMNLNKHPEMLKDDLMPNSLVMERGDYIMQNFKALVQEYCHTRYLFYQYKDYEIHKKNIVHKSEKNNYTKTSPIILSYNKIGDDTIAITTNYTDENYILSFEIEQLKSAYSKLYNILDKLSVLLISYIKLIDKKEPYLENIRQNSLIKDDKLSLASFQYILKIDDLKKINPYLYSFCSIYQDIVCDDTFKIKYIRNKITHGFIKICWYSDNSSNEDNKTIEANFEKISLHEFKDKFLFLIKFVRNQFFNTVSCISFIEKSISS